MSSGKVLIISEGIKPEDKFFKCIEKHLEIKDTEFLYFGTTIYQLMDKLQSDELYQQNPTFINTFDVLKEIHNFGIGNDDLFNTYKQSDFSLIFLFFDFDPQDHKRKYKPTDYIKPYDNVKNDLETLLSVFDDSTGCGKLFINYPSSESFQHFIDKDSFLISMHSHVSDPKYKTHVKKELKLYNNILLNISTYTANTIKLIFEMNLIKANFLCNNCEHLPINIDEINQNNILINQFNGFSLYDTVFILSSIPVFYAELIGLSKLIEKFDTITY